jgi:hypothetical protein
MKEETSTFTLSNPLPHYISHDQIYIQIFFFARQQLYTFCLCLQGKGQVTLYMFTSFYFIMQHINHSIIFDLKGYKLWIKLIKNII